MLVRREKVIVNEKEADLGAKYALEQLGHTTSESDGPVAVRR